jgi:diguanylate cyclase (GGDEF)-like protein/PAS domain S-box-containing protein
MNLVDVKDIHDGMNKVKTGELYGFVGTLATTGYEIQKNYIGELKIAGKFDDTWELGIGTRNDMPLLNIIFNKAIAAIPPDKQQETLNKWISVKYEKGVDYSLALKLAAAFVTILILVLISNRRIRRVNDKLMLAHKELEQTNKLVEEKSDQLIEQQNMVDKHVIISTANLNGEITSANEAFENISGYTEEELIGKSHNIVRSPDTPADVFQDMWDAIKNGQTWQGEIENYNKSNEPYWVSMNIGPIYDSNDKICGYRSIQKDITDKKKIEKLSITDNLTGLYNRMRLDEILNTKLHELRRYNNPFSVILIDIDNFKNINDSFGHDAGDHVLKELATIFTNNVRATDTVGRWGGEEFAIICGNTSQDGAAELAEKVRFAVESHDMKLPLKVTSSLGVAECNKEDSIASLFKRADENLYEAKKTGKNRVVVK